MIIENKNQAPLNEENFRLFSHYYWKSPESPDLHSNSLTYFTESLYSAWKAERKCKIIYNELLKESNKQTSEVQEISELRIPLDERIHDFFTKVAKQLQEGSDQLFKVLPNLRFMTTPMVGGAQGPKPLTSLKIDLPEHDKNFHLPIGSCQLTESPRGNLTFTLKNDDDGEIKELDELEVDCKFLEVDEKQADDDEEQARELITIKRRRFKFNDHLKCFECELGKPLKLIGERLLSDPQIKVIPSFYVIPKLNLLVQKIKSCLIDDTQEVSSDSFNKLLCWFYPFIYKGVRQFFPSLERDVLNEYLSQVTTQIFWSFQYIKIDEDPYKFLEDKLYEKFNQVLSI